jgi:hypothetical protein
VLTIIFTAVRIRFSLFSQLLAHFSPTFLLTRCSHTFRGFLAQEMLIRIVALGFYDRKGTGNSTPNLPLLVMSEGSFRGYLLWL